MSENLIKYALQPLWKSKEPLSEDRCRECVALVFHLVLEHVGEEKAYEIFGKFGPSSKRTRQEFEQWKLLRRYDEMDTPNVKKLARELSGAQGSEKKESIERHLRRLISERRKRIESRTWNGPFPHGSWGDIFDANLSGDRKLKKKSAY